jgi:katanin p60 ATPase-containing subunit A1
VAIDLSTGILKQFQEAEHAARQHLDRGEYAQAARYLRQCHNLMKRYAEQPNTGDIVRRMRLERAENYLTLALQAESQVKRGAEEPTPLAALPERNASNDYQAVIEGLITRVGVRWADIGGLERTKEEIQLNYALGMVQYPPGLAIQPMRRLLFYGPPGTGKTMLAAAISNEIDATFFNVRIPDMLSQYFGESSKLISALYATAATHAPSVVFLDEIDALSRQRGGSQESGAERRLLNTFLSELDGLQNKRDDAPFTLTVGATNVPWELDRAVLSRFSGGMVYVPLPDADARRAILNLYIGGRGHRSDVSLERLIQRTNGYAGREIEQIVGMAARHMLRRANPDLLRHAANGQDALRSYRLQAHPLAEEDFHIAFEQIKPASPPAQVRRYEEWGKSWE